MSFEPKLVGFLCNWCSYTGADLAGTARMKYPPNVRVDPRDVLGARRPELHPGGAGAGAPTACSSAAATRATATTPRATTSAMRRLPLTRKLARADGRRAPARPPGVGLGLGGGALRARS